MTTTKEKGQTMRKIGNTRVAAIAAALALSFGVAHATELTVVNFGGANGDAQKAALPRVPRDPREAMLRKKLEAAQGSQKTGFETETPPTGSRNRKPT